ncbi:MAG: LCP family protein, partial [bacterium]
MTIPPAKDSSYTIQQSTRPPGRRWLILILTLLCCFFLLASCVTLYVWKVVGSQFDLIWKKEESVSRVVEFNVVIAGLDEVDNLHRTDSIAVAHVNMKDKTVGIIFLPRDTRVEIPGRGYDKVNSAYTRGEIPLMLKTLEQFLDIEIKYYAILRISAFVK